MNINEIFSAKDIILLLLGGVIGAFTQIFLQHMWEKFQERNSALTGKWEERIYRDDKGIEVEKIDTVICSQRGESIKAYITRNSPPSQKGRTWVFHGRYRQGVLFGHFWSKDTGHFSFGTIFLRNAPGNKFAGHYIRLARVTIDRWDSETLSISKIPLEWVKIIEK